MKARRTKRPGGVPAGKTTMCYISGIAGRHPIKVGIAYWYRGHYIYNDRGLPIEPLPFATKKRVLVAGIPGDSAPPYEHRDKSLRPQHEINALLYAEFNERESLAGAGKQLQVDEDEDEDKESNLRGTPIPKIITPVDDPMEEEMVYQKSQSKSRRLNTHPYNATPESSEWSILQSSDRPGSAQTKYYFPHDRAQFLASSAPGSANNSRPGSPRQGGTLRPIVSSSRLRQLLAEEGIKRPASPYQDHHNVNQWLLDEIENTDDEQLFLRSSSKSPAPASQSRSPSLAVWSASARKSSAPPSIITSDVPIRDTIEYKNATIREKNTSRLGRPRGASIVLNEAYNASPKKHPNYAELMGDTADKVDNRVATPQANLKDAVTSSTKQKNKKKKGSYVFGTSDTGPSSGGRVTRCPIHDEPCDGLSVTRPHLTEATRNGRGFKDLYPVLKDGPRTMIDWAQLLDEELGVVD